MTGENAVTLALPSKGAIYEPTMNFLRNCGLRVHKPNPRQYTGSIPTVPSLNVLFQRVTDVVYKVSDGTAQLGITGYDVVSEHPHDDMIVIHPQLGYGHCRLVVAVPEAWVDVTTMTDLLEVSLDMREGQQRNLRVATKNTTLARSFLHEKGIHHFSLVKADGAIEAAPTLGYADVIVDLVQTGTTLRENHLKELPDGIIVESQACLIGNRRALETSLHTLQTTRTFLEYIDGALNGRNYYQITANMHGTNAEDVALRVADHPATRGLRGPTVSPIYSPNVDASNGDRWYMVTLTIADGNLLSAVEHLRFSGGSQIVAMPVDYVFLESSPTFDKLLTQLNLQ